MKDQIRDAILMPLLHRLGSISAGATLALLPALDVKAFEGAFVVLALVAVDLAVEGYKRRK